MQAFNRLRLFHWTLAGLFALAWLSGDEGELLHVWVGYGVLALLLVRTVLAVLRTHGFSRLLPQSGGGTQLLVSRLLALAMLGSLLLTALLGLGMVDHGEVLGQALSPFWPDARQQLAGVSILDLSDRLEDPAEVHEFMANLSLLLVGVHTGWVLLCRRRMAWALLRGAPAPAPRKAQAATSSVVLQVVAVREQTSTAVDIELQVPESERARFAAARPGQFISLQVPCAATPLWRSYSLSRLPDADGRLRITVRRVAGGRASSWLASQLHAGMTLSARGPAGQFTPSSPNGDFLLIAAGSGITPMLPILRAVLEHGDGVVTLLQVERNADSLLFADELAALARRWPQRLQLRRWLSDEQGRLDGDALLLQVWGELQAECFLCGPQGFMDMVSAELLQSGMLAAQLHREQFGPVAQQVRGAGAQRVAVEQDGQRQQLEVAEGEVLLAAMERAGLPVPGGCRSGVCLGCRCQVKAGQVQTAMPLPAELPAGWTLACQASPAGAGVVVAF